MDDSGERYIRWQDYRIAQLSHCINLFLGFAVASLIYVVNLRLDDASPGKLPLNDTIFWWSTSALFGCLATVSKLLDYRFTAKAVRHKEGSGAAAALGYITWAAFWVEMGSYVAGAFVFMRAVLQS